MNEEGGESKDDALNAFETIFKNTAWKISIGTDKIKEIFGEFEVFKSNVRKVAIRHPFIAIQASRGNEKALAFLIEEATKRYIKEKNMAKKIKIRSGAEFNQKKLEKEWQEEEQRLREAALKKAKESEAAGEAEAAAKIRAIEEQTMADKAKGNEAGAETAAAKIKTEAQQTEAKTAQDAAKFQFDREQELERLRKEQQDTAQKSRGIFKRTKGWLAEHYDAEKERRQARAIGGAVAGVGRGAGRVAAGVGYGMAAIAAAPLMASGSVFWFFNIAMFLHLIDVFTNFGRDSRGVTGLRFGIYLFLMLYAWFALYGGASVGGLNTLWKPAIISSLSFLLPFLLSYLLEIPLSTDMQNTITALLIFIPLWPIIVAFGMAPAGSKYFMVWRLIFIAIWVFAALPTLYNAFASDFNLGASKINVFNSIRFVGGLIKTNVLAFWAGLKGIPKIISGGVQQQIQYATGDYYTGMVDDNQNEPIGVYLENIQAANEKFFDEDSVVIWGVIKAKTLNPDKEIKIKTSCYAEKEDIKEKGDADPTNPPDEFDMTVTVMEEKDITCEFAPGKLKEGIWDVYFSSTFNFDTHSYLKAYFMDQDRIRAIRRQNKDPLDVYGIQDKSPAAVFTNGPLMVGMETTQPLMGLSNKERNELRLGITLENRWEGNLKEIKDLMIKIPPSMSIAFCDYNIKQESCREDECEDGKYKVVYRLQEKADAGKRGKESLKNIEQFQTISCRLNIENVDAALGDTPISTQYFKVSADYIYELKGSVPVTIEKVSQTTTI